MQDQLQSIVINAVVFIKRFIQPLLQNLDPSLFQNIILGILAIFIPFAIVFLTDILGSKRERSEFEKMVLSEEVLGAKKIFWFSIIVLGVLSFFAGKNISLPEKLSAIFITFFSILVFGRFFKRTLRFSEGYKSEFEISFLKSLNLSKFLSFGNKLKTERMLRAWHSFWAEKLSYNERGFTQIFITHIDDAIKNNKFSLAVFLAQEYKNNINKRDGFSVGSEILPKLFEWSEEFWEAQQRWIYRNNLGEKIQNLFSQKYLPTFRKWAFNLSKKVFNDDDFFWNWNYFQQDFFPIIAKVLLSGGHEPYQLFACFKKYIDDAEAKLEKIETEKDRQAWWNHILSLFGSFCPMFFETIDSIPNKYDVWEHYFPGDWKISATNSKKRIPRIILNEFLEWAQKRIFKKVDGTDYDRDLTEVIGGIFPGAHTELLPAFLTLFFSGDIKYAVEKEPDFFLVGAGVSWWGEKSDEELQQMLQQMDQSQKAETIDMIFSFFGHWRVLKLFKDDITGKEFSEWGSYSEEQKKLIISRVRKIKLQEILSELEGTEIVELSRLSEQREYRRKSFIKLTQALLDQNT